MAVPTRPRSAEQWLAIFLSRWGDDMTPRRLASLKGVASRLAKSPPSSSWGRSLRARKGGLARQRRLRIEGQITVPESGEPATPDRVASAVASYLRGQLKNSLKQDLKPGEYLFCLSFPLR